MSERDSTDEPRSRRLFREVGGVYGGVLAVIIVAAVLASFVSLVAQFLYAIVAFLFFFVPQWWLDRKELDPERFGLTSSEWVKGVGWGLLFTLGTIPFFIGGYWVWETYFLDRQYEFDWEHYQQWSADMEGEPEDWGQDEPGVWIWSDDDLLKIGVRNTDLANNRVIIRADETFHPRKRGTLNLTPLRDEKKAARDGDESRAWEVALTHSRSRGVVTVEGVNDVSVDVEPVAEGRKTWPIYLGPTAREAAEGRFEGSRGLMWLLLWMATQVILIALPEEYFYRGYVQTRLADAFEARREEQGKEGELSILGFTPAIFVTSVCFGLGHLLVPVGGAILANRIAVFFPSLLFGWLRRHTGSIVASTVYHAFSNMMVLLAAVHFS